MDTTIGGRGGCLVGKDYKVVAFKALPTAHQFSIIHYMALDGAAWRDFTASELLSSADKLRAYVNHSRNMLGTMARPYGVLQTSTRKL
jgi:hypothetical protein